MICATCQGFGQIKGARCDICAGQGIISKPKPKAAMPTPAVLAPSLDFSPHAITQPPIPPQRATTLPPFVLGTARVTVIVLGEGPAVIATIQSALALPNPELEVLFVDDGSTDGTAALAAEISDQRFLLLRRPWKSGHGRELGMAQASGQRVLFLYAGETARPV